VVESPHPALDDHLGRYGIATTWLDKVPSTAALVDALRATRAQVLFKRSRVTVPREVFESCPDLHVVALCCIGDDSIDKDAAAEHGVLVVNDPVSNARSVVEMAITHLIALSRRFYDTNEATHRNVWDKDHSHRYEVAGKVLGVVGLGNIGRQVARVAEQLGMQVQFHDSRPVAQEVGTEMGWRAAGSLSALFRSSDLVTVHVSARDAWGKENEGLLDDVLPLLAADRPEASPRAFVNLARGNVHSAEALVEAVRSGAIRRAAVDVYPEEPRPGAPWVNPYGNVPEIVCTPHIGAATQEAQPRIAARVARTVGELSRFGSLRDCVFAPRGNLAAPPPNPGEAMLAVVHSTARGTRKAVQDAVYEAEASVIASVQQDFPNGVAYELCVLDRPVSEGGLRAIASRAADLTGAADAVRAIRQVVVQPGW
jgi:D-3-phosphoglycerate dehydrogenase